MNEYIDTSMAVESGSELVTQISLALRELQPNQRQRKEKEFAAHFNEIKTVIEQGVSHKDVRLALAKGGLSMSSPTFRKLLEAEWTRRDANSDQEDTRPLFNASHVEKAHG